MGLNESERRRLLRFARETIGAHLRRETPPALDASGGLDCRRGAFVTVRLDRTLRGCIGYLEADRLLGEVVAGCAISAATEDPRFAPLGPAELARVDLEISVLGPVEVVADIEAIEVGRHGLIVAHGRRRGLLLPQVALEWTWDRHTFLAQTCVKAGLALDAWQKGADVFRFEAEVFGERETARGLPASPER